MLITEYRIVLPVSVEEYQVGQLYAVAQASKDETGGGEGVQVFENEPYEKDGEKGQYTKKIYHLQSKVPAIIRALAPHGSLEIHEEAWNAYPYCKTILTNPWMGEQFRIEIATWHKPDMGDQDNVHGIENAEREIVYIDIADRKDINQGDYKPELDPAIFKSEKTGRGPLGPDWKKEVANNSNCPHMCAYKLVTVKCKWRGFQTKLEKTIQKMERRIFANFHRQLFCWIDNWIDLSMDDIRRMEDETKKELDNLRAGDEVKGMAVASDCN